MAQHMYQYSLFHCYLTVVVYSTSPCRSTVLTSLYAPLPRRGYHGRAAAAAAAASTAPLPGTAWRATKAPQSRPQDAGGNRSGGMSVGRGSTPARVHLVPKYAVAAADAALAATVVAETSPAVVKPPRRPPRPRHPMHGRRACPVAWVSALRGPRLPVGRSSRKKQLRVGTARWLCSGPCPEVSACLGSYDRVLLRPSRCADVPTPASESGQRDCGERANTFK
jgi:hypothetical protein